MARDGVCGMRGRATGPCVGGAGPWEADREIASPTRSVSLTSRGEEIASKDS
jgi:hypothetical protein